MILTIRPDRQRAKSLKVMAETTLKRLQSTDIYCYPANTLTDYYDIIHKLMESLLYIGGYRIKGEGAHKELIDFACSEYGLSEQSRRFLQQLREYRNRIAYEGFFIKSDYIMMHSEEINSIVLRLIRKLEEKFVK